MALDNIKKAAREEEKSLRINFDQAVKEAQSKAIIVEFRGKEYKLPGTAPAWLPIFVASRQDGGMLKDRDNVDLIEGLLGKEFVSMIVDKRENFVSLNDVNDKIIEPVMRHWGLDISAGKTKKKK